MGKKLTTSEFVEKARQVHGNRYDYSVEYNGKQHYVEIDHFGGKLGLKDTQYRDELKRKKCEQNNCNLFEIKYNYTEDDYQKLVENIQNIIANK